MTKYRLQERTDGIYIQVKYASVLLLINGDIGPISYLFSYVMWVEIEQHCGYRNEDDILYYIDQIEKQVERDKEEISNYFSGKNIIKTKEVKPRK
jgi:hypothetical protein